MPDKLTMVVGSTRGKEEEQFVIDAIGKVGLENLQIIHAPRHLETVEDLAASVREQLGTAARRSKGETGPYLILDSYGELSSVYSLADIVVVGGGFSNLGGQNLIQPLAHGKPVLHGPHMQNFRDAADMARYAGATMVCNTPQELAEAILLLMGSPEMRASMSEKASNLVQASLGASARYGEAIKEAAIRAADSRVR